VFGKAVPHTLFGIQVSRYFHGTGFGLVRTMQLFPHGRIQYTPLLLTHFHVNRHCARLLLCCHLSHSNETYKSLAPLLLSVAQQRNLQITGAKVHPVLPYYQHSSLTSWANIIILYYFQRAPRTICT
jgi:hypothetical protein